jgi:hypothetical protein
MLMCSGGRVGSENSKLIEWSVWTVSQFVQWQNSKFLE